MIIKLIASLTQPRTDLRKKCFHSHVSCSKVDAVKGLYILVLEGKYTLV
jgi:hypothetical protein